MKSCLLFVYCLFLGNFFAQNKEENKTILNEVPPTNNYTNSAPTEFQDTATFKAGVKMPSEEISTKKAKAGSSNSVLKKSEKSATQIQEYNSNSQQQSSTFQTVKSSAASQSTQRSPSPSQQSEMNKTVSFYQQNAPNSFEYHYFKYLAGNYDISLIDDLLAAQKLKPNNVDVRVQLAAYYFIKKEDKKLKDNLEFLFKNQKIEEELTIYAQDLLNSTEKGGSLLTHGFDDTYSVLYLQYVKGIRKDVRLISLDFMQSSYYREELKKNGYQIPSETVIDVRFLKKFCELNSNTSIQLSMTFPKPYLKELINQLQILGLTFSYSNIDSADLFEKNEQFYEKDFQNASVVKFKSDKCKKLSSNYLPFLLSLEEAYKQQGEEQKRSVLQHTIAQIKTQANITQSLNSY